MPRPVVRSLLAFALVLALGACDRSELDDDGPPLPPPPNPPGQVNTCTARIDGEGFTATAASASATEDGTTLDVTCSAGAVRFIAQVRPSGFGPATLPLGVPGNRVQYTVGSEVVVTVDLGGGEDVGEIVLSTFTTDRVVGSFRINLPGFEEDDPIIRVTEGQFDIAVSLAVP